MTETLLTLPEALVGARAVAHALGDADGLTFDHGRAARLLLSYLDTIERATTPTPTAWPAPSGSMPTLAALGAWLEEGACYATDGICWIEPDGVCEHGHPSWLLYLGMI